MVYIYCSECKKYVMYRYCASCMKIKCTYCCNLDICRFCHGLICEKCYTGCSSLGDIHCNICLFDHSGCDHCDNQICEECKNICQICNKNLCHTCFGNSTSNICKFCIWFTIKYTRNKLTTKFPIEIMDIIKQFYLND